MGLNGNLGILELEGDLIEFQRDANQTMVSMKWKSGQEIVVGGIWYMADIKWIFNDDIIEFISPMFRLMYLVQFYWHFH